MNSDAHKMPRNSPTSTSHAKRQNWQILVVPESGTEQLAGISGTLTITNRDGKHFYELLYTPPGA